MNSTNDDPLVGHVLDGRYEVLRRRARGGMATVYLAKDRRLQRLVAIKVMHENLGEDTDYARTFDREARAAAMLSDPHIVGVFDQGEDQGRPFIVMEYVDGYTLRNVITQEAPLTPERALSYLESIAAALSAAHQANLIHRDVKPENVLISAKGEVKVADFGLARPISGQTITSTQDVLIGTVSYLAPERVTMQEADARSDVYSSGVVLYEMLTGHKPFTGDIPIQVAYQHVNSQINAPSQLVGGKVIPPYVDELVIACTRRNPELRPADGAELLKRVREAKAGIAAGVWDDPELSARMNPYRFAEDTPPAAPTSKTLLAAAEPPAEAPDVDAAVQDLDAQVAAEDEDWAEHTPELPLDPTPDKRIKRSRNDQAVFRRRRGIVIGILVLVVALAVGLTSWWFLAGRYTQMPNLINQTQDQATAAAQQAGLSVRFEEDYSEDVEKGLVARTDPEPDTKVLKQAEVVAFISKGPERYAVPALAGLTVEEAGTALAAQNLSLATPSEAYDETVPAGQIISFSPGKGELVKRDTQVSVVVSKGREPIPVTDYTGQNALDAANALQGIGLTVTMEDTFSNDIAEGLVVSQDPSSGTLYRGDTVKLAVSKGPDLVTVPNVKWSNVDTAKKTIEDAGLVADVRYKDGAWLRVVDSMDPPAGTQVKSGTTIILYVG